MCQFFFSNKRNVYERYAEFFEYENQNKQMDSEGLGDTSKVDIKENTIRFYFALSYNLAKEDITKIQQIDELPLYLCLNISALVKERYLKEKQELDKLRKNIKA